jgi:hypothetical protein
MQKQFLAEFSGEDPIYVVDPDAVLVYNYSFNRLKWMMRTLMTVTLDRCEQFAVDELQYNVKIVKAGHGVITQLYD